MNSICKYRIMKRLIQTHNNIVSHNYGFNKNMQFQNAWCHLLKCVKCYSIKNDNVVASSSTESNEKEKVDTATKDRLSSPISSPVSKNPGIEADLAVMTDDKVTTESTLKTESIVPGKGPPPEPPVTCCMTGCANCVWIMYAEELRDYYADGGEEARKAIDQIQDPSLKAFVKLELGF